MFCNVEISHCRRDIALFKCGKKPSTRNKSVKKINSYQHQPKTIERTRFPPMSNSNHSGKSNRDDAYLSPHHQPKTEIQHVADTNRNAFEPFRCESAEFVPTWQRLTQPSPSFVRRRWWQQLVRPQRFGGGPIGILARVR